MITENIDSSYEDKIKYLEKQLSKSLKIQEALMSRVERSVQMSGSEYAIFETNAILQKLIDNKNTELMSINLDLQRQILERDRIESSLKQSQERLNSIVDSLVDVVYSRSYPDFNTLFLSSSAEKIYQRSTEDFYNNKDLWIELVHPEDQPEILNKIEAAYSGKMQEANYRIFLPSGDIRWLRDRFRVVFDNYGAPIRFDGIVSDINSEKEAEEQIRQNEYKFRTLADYTMDWEYWINPDNNYVYISTSCKDISGYAPEEFIANHDLMLTIIHPDDYDSFSTHLEDSHSKDSRNTVEEMEIRIMRKDSQLRYIQHICRPIFDHQGNYLGRRVSNRDITERKLAEIELKNKNHLIESILDNAPILIWLNDTEGNLKFGNRFLGACTISEDGTHSRTPEEFDDCAITDKLTLDDKIPKEFIEEATFVDGKKHYIQTVKTKMFDEYGTVIGILGLGLDITESLKAREALVESEERNRALLNASPDLVFILSEDGLFLDYHTSNPDQLLLPPRIFMNKNLKDVLPTELAGNLQMYIHKAVEQKTLQTYEYDVTYKGKTKFYEARINTFGTNQVMAMIRDITDSKIAAVKLDELYKLHTIINEISSKLIQSSLDEVNLSIVEALEKLGKYSNVDRVYIFNFNYDRQDMDNTHEWCSERSGSIKSNLQNIPIDSIPCWLEKFKKNEYVYIPSVDEIDPEFQVEKILLDRFSIKSLVTVPMFYGNRLLGFIGFDSAREKILWDFDKISLLKLAGEIIAGAVYRYKFEQEIIKQKQIADSANKAKSEFLANMSHEIRTPMNAILGFSEIMLNSGKYPTQKGYLETIQKSGITLLSLINDILDLSKIEAGMLELQLGAVRIFDVVDDITQIFSQQIKSKKLSFEVNIQSDVPEYLFIDEVRIRQVLLNLVGNAVKFTKEGGIILSISAEPIDETHHNLRIIVKDTGIGIPPEDRDIIFESFRQASGISIKHFGGTGLGLAISNRLVTMMNGTITLQSELGKGSVFTVVLNNVCIVESVEKLDSQVDWTNKSIDFGDRKILIVDDIQQNIDIVKIYLENTNLVVLDVHSGEEALNSIKTLMPDLILMDIRMPGMSGSKATELLKKDDFTSSIPVVAFTASSMKRDENKIKVIFDGFLRKPINRNELINELIRHLPYSYMGISANSGSISDDSFLEFHPLSKDFLERIVELDDTFSSRVQDLITYMDLSEVQQFITELNDFISFNQLDMFKKYVKLLSTSYDNFDIEKLEELLREFSALTKKAKAYMTA